jgi:hypothetical protein
VLLRRHLLGIIISVSAASAQQPFYTDDASVTDIGVWHFEFFNEFDLLQPALYPNLKQNTSNYRLNYGLPFNLEVDVDSPYLALFRAPGEHPRRPYGVGDTNVGVKWNFRKESAGSRLPAMSVTLYLEFPTGDTGQQLGSGLVDYALNAIVQKHLSENVRLTVNAGILFAGNTSTGLLGIQNTRGRVFTGGLSALRDVTPRLTLGGEVYGGITGSPALAKSQLQFLAGGKYELRKGLSFDFGLLTGRYVGSPRIGVQLGFSYDLPNSPRLH